MSNTPVHYYGHNGTLLLTAYTTQWYMHRFILRRADDPFGRKFPYTNWRVSRGQERVFSDPPRLRKNAKADGPTFGHFPQGHTELRAGMAGDSLTRGTTGTVSHGPEVFSKEEYQTMLGHKALFREDQAGVSSMGVSDGTSLLVHQRDVLRGQGAEELAREDGDMPAVHGIRELVCATAGIKSTGRERLLPRDSVTRNTATGAAAAERGGGVCVLR